MVKQSNLRLTHLLRIILVVTGLTLGLVYPFMPGSYDPLARPLSTLIQVMGLLGLPLALWGMIWIMFPLKFKVLAHTAWSMGVVLTLAGLFVTVLMGSRLFGFFLLIISGGLFSHIRQKMRSAVHQASFSWIPVYLISIPVAILLIQLLSAKPVTDWSRNHTIIQAAEYLRDIENYKIKNGYYPPILQAMYQDYFPQTIGVEKYFYLPYGDAYNLSFEQPRFLLDIPGTKEWVVYNPQNEHRVYSHTSWFLLLTPAESALSQGWYESKDTKHPRWKSFFFD